MATRGRHSAHVCEGNEGCAHMRVRAFVRDDEGVRQVCGACKREAHTHTASWVVSGTCVRERAYI